MTIMEQRQALNAFSPHLATLSQVKRPLRSLPQICVPLDTIANVAQPLQLNIRALLVITVPRVHPG